MKLPSSAWLTKKRGRAFATKKMLESHGRVVADRSNIMLGITCNFKVRFVLRHWHGERQFPKKEDMLMSETEEATTRIFKKHLQKRRFHMMGPEQGQYYDDLANIAGVTPLPPVLTKLHNESSKRFLDDLVHYRQDRYRIIDDYNFVQF